MQLAVLGGSGLLSGGFFTKVALLGASVAGSMLLNGRKKPVGKLNDLRVSSASYGRGIPWVWGTMRVTGNMFWSTDFREEKVYMTSKGKEKSGSMGKKKEKKGKAQPMYKYYANFAMGLCEGPMDDVLRIWADNNLIYNKYNPDDEDLVTPGFSTRDDDNTGKSSQKSAGGKKGNDGQSGRFAWRFYDGSEDQMPDPYMEKMEGVGKCPAYRGTCYLMFQDFALEDFGNRIPTITAEVTSRAAARPQLLRMENLPEPDVGWKRQFVQDTHHFLDVQREMLYTIGNDNTDYRPIVRVYDIAKRKEVKRIDFAEHMPQTAPHGDFKGNPILNDQRTRTWTAEDTKSWEIIGITPAGDFAILTPEGNYSPIIFYDPFANKVIKSWGRSGNIIVPIWNGIFVPSGSFNAIATRATMQGPKPFPVLIVFSAFGDMTVFDSDYNKIGVIGSDGRRTNHCIGTPGTTQSIYFSNTGYGGPNQCRFYTAPLEFTQNEILAGWDGSTFAEHEKFLCQWPEVAGSRGQMVGINYMSFIVGANCVGVLFSAYGGPHQGMWAVKFDAITGEMLWEKKIDIAAVNLWYISNFITPPPYNNTNYTNFYHNGTLFKVDWRQEKVTSENFIGNQVYPTMLRDKYYWSERDAHVGFAPTVDDPDSYQPVILYNDRKVQTAVGLDQVCLDVATKAGIDPLSVVTTGLGTQEPLNGYMIEQPTEARSILEELANCYQFDAVETDYKLVFKMRGGESLLTIPDTHLGVVDVDFGTDNERIVETIQYQSELPERVTVSFYDPKNEYENGSQYFKRPTLPVPVTLSREHVEVTFNMALLNKYAKRMAKRILYAAWSERTTLEFKLPRDYLRLDPSDTVTIALRDGRNVEVRITDITTGADMMLECAGVYNYPDSYKQTADTDNPDGVVKQPPSGVSSARPLLFNTPYLSDSHEQPGDNFGYYWGAASSKSGFNFGMLQSAHDGSNWRNEGTTTLDALWGYVQEVIPPPPVWNAEDTTTTIALNPAFDFNDPEVVYTWESIPDSEWPSEQNMILIGNEIILFKDVVENPNGSVTISRLIRGYRGSINAAYTHTMQDRWALVHDGSIHLGSEDLTYLNEQQQFMINTGVAFANFGYQVNFTLDGSTERPLPVGDIRRVNNVNGSVTFNWSRSTRIGGTLKNGTGTIPLAEEQEKYFLFVLSSPYDPKTWNPDDPTKFVWKSEELTTPTATVTAASLTALGLSNTVDLHIVIHQMSNEVGYGYPHGLTKTYARY